MKLLILAVLAIAALFWARVAHGLVFRQSGARPGDASGPLQCGAHTWLPYEDDDGFGYREWICQQARGHAGKHAGWLGEPEYDGEAVGIG